MSARMMAQTVISDFAVKCAKIPTDVIWTAGDIRSHTRDIAHDSLTAALSAATIGAATTSIVNMPSFARLKGT
jgi:hypothetical protein